MTAACRTSLQELWELLVPLTPTDRHRVLREALSFLPGTAWELSDLVGQARALLADAWESHAGRALPIRAVRQIVSDCRRFTVRALLWEAAECATQTEFSTTLISVLGELDRQSRSEYERQLSLFADIAPEPRERPCRVPRGGQIVSSLKELIAAGRKFPTIYADPPWPYANEASRGAAVNHYPVLSLDDIRQEPVGELAADNAHLHLWTTNGFLREALDLIDAWGFTYKSCFVWLKPDLGCGNYWRVSHEFLLLGVRGRLRFRDRTLPSWLIAPRMEHSRKPGRVRLLIERVSPGPYLELYGRSEIPDADWTVYGNQVERRLF